jgi:o-succinylbenzoate synthase
MGMMTARFFRYDLQFKQPAGTSRGFLSSKPSWFILLEDDDQPGRFGLGECSIIEGLSPDPVSLMELELQRLCNDPLLYLEEEDRLIQFPAIRMGLETAFLDLKGGGNRILYSSSFTLGQQGIPINGLIWMGTVPFMMEQVEQNLEKGFRCLKMKIGALGFEQELSVLREIRRRFSASDLELRVDANGAFSAQDALGKLDQLSVFHLHSIEQPIKPGNWEDMSRIVSKSPIPIALDEELFFPSAKERKQNLLEIVRPHYLVLKPSLLGGFTESMRWIQAANGLGIPWWITSALESNVGLSAIAQWTAIQAGNVFQGLGTGSLFANNIASPLIVKNGRLFYFPEGEMDWDYSVFGIQNWLG